MPTTDISINLHEMPLPAGEDTLIELADIRFL